MIRNLKALGLAAVAVLAMSAVVASAAQAAEFHSETTPTTLKGSQATANVFTAGGSEVSCTTANFEGTQSGNTAESVTIHPSYSGCKAFGFATAHISTTGCNYIFTASSSTSGNAKVECEGSSKISITPTFLGFSVCTLTIGAQEPTGSVDYKGEGSGSSRDVLVTSTVTGIAYTEDGEGCGVGSGSDGTYTGSVTEKGFDSGGTQVGVWVE